MPLEKQFDQDIALSRVLDAFWSRGYEATSMQDLVDCTGVNRASLYATYGDKRALFRAALEKYDADRRAMLASIEASHSPRAAIREVFHAYADSLRPGQDSKGCFLTNTALDLGSHDSTIRSLVSAAQRDMEIFFKRQIEAGKKTGEFRSDIDPAAASKALLASLIGIVVLVRSRPESNLLKSIVDDALKRLR